MGDVSKILRSSLAPLDGKAPRRRHRSVACAGDAATILTFSKPSQHVARYRKDEPGSAMTTVVVHPECDRPIGSFPFAIEWCVVRWLDALVLQIDTGKESTGRKSNKNI